MQPKLKGKDTERRLCAENKLFLSVSLLMHSEMVGIERAVRACNKCYEANEKAETDRTTPYDSDEHDPQVLATERAIDAQYDAISAKYYAIRDANNIEALRALDEARAFFYSLDFMDSSTFPKLEELAGIWPNLPYYPKMVIKLIDQMEGECMLCKYNSPRISDILFTAIADNAEKKPAEEKGEEE